MFVEEALSCIQVSINNGASFTDTCDSRLATVKVPLIKDDNFTPTNSHVQDIEYLSINGERFAAD